MMICPKCKAEYRDGFTTCVDCEVSLVPDYAENSQALATVTEPDVEDRSDEDDPFCSFWKGEDGRISAEICQLLDENHVPYRILRRSDRLFNIASQPAFEIGIPFSQFARAETLLKEAYGDPAAEENPQAANSEESQPLQGNRFLRTASTRGLIAAIGERIHEDTDNNSAEDFDTPKVSRRAWDPTAWFPEDATCMVWSGDEVSLGEMLAASLSENEIHSRLDARKGESSLYVLVEDEKAAREIVRQVMEGTPPE
jgi:hypothetical protein